MRKSFLLILLLVTSVTVLMSFFKPKEKLYKNLKVLPKDISKADMDSVMKHFSSSLGVRCNFCHVRLNNEKKDWDFASDSLDHKKFARYMYTMTQKINKKYFKDDVKNIDMPMANEITCYSCHNGNKEPGKIPPPEQRRPAPSTPPTTK